MAFAGFSAIVVLFKRRDSGRWRAADADRFHGMVVHSMAAAFFCVFPALVAVFTSTPEIIWNVSSGVLGLQIISHVVLVLSLASTGWGSRISLGVGFVVAGGLQALNLLGLGFAHEFGPYLVGVLWHVFQSGVLFVWLIWVSDEDIEGS